MHPAYSRIGSFIAILLLCSLSLSSCSTAHTPGIPINKQGAEALASSHQAQRLTMAIIFATADPVYKQVTKSAKAAAAKADIQLIVKAPNEANLEQQIRIMENLIKQKVDGIAISPVDSEAMTPYIDKAAAAGIKVICFDNDAPNSKRLAYFGIDNYEAGRRMAEYVDKLLGGQGMVIAETGMISFNNIRQRVAGFKDYLAGSSGVQLLELRTDGDHADQATANIEEMIEDHPHFDAFVGFDSQASSSAILVWKAKGLRQFAVTFNNTPLTLNGIRNDQITATIDQSEDRWGDIILQQLTAACSGQPLPVVQQLNAKILTRDNWNKEALDK
ncbi:substrate-binding domain-containing protein [Paenibacillus sp. YPG26]|uniref:substrate-binding domain-containing protein n=1 Tax=Paenibacillus sp. YPG26 TaxID=2878915 RepID=UPI00203E49E0|nr:substrate-binding domain-containing protein [Paenibacillus sp. YPG26]USB34382.1 substrate-binding domain-containing protein [Paenibacillus sp. YPG26]